MQWDTWVLQVRAFVRNVEGTGKQELNQSPLPFIESASQPGALGPLRCCAEPERNTFEADGAQIGDEVPLPHSAVDICACKKPMYGCFL